MATRKQVIAVFDRFAPSLIRRERGESEAIIAEIRTLIETMPSSDDVLRECWRRSLVWGLTKDQRTALQLILKGRSPVEDRVKKKDSI